MSGANRSFARSGAHAIATTFRPAAPVLIDGPRGAGDDRVNDDEHRAQCRKLLETLRRSCPELLPRAPLLAGQSSAPLPVPASGLSQLARTAVRAASGLRAADGGPRGVVWAEGDRELYVDVQGIDVVLAPGAVAVTVPVRCDQSGEAAVSISFAVGTAERPLGLVAATEDRPRGPALVVDVWGEALLALAWQCVLDIAAGVSAAVGADAAGTPLIPGALTCDGRSLWVTPQARFAFDAAGLVGR